MKLKIISKQIYEDHEEELKQENECEIEHLPNNITKITYEKNTIIIEENKITNGTLVIDNEKETENVYETEHGQITLKIKCLEMKKETKPIKATAKYQIIIGNTPSHINEIKIEVI